MANLLQRYLAKRNYTTGCHLSGRNLFREIVRKKHDCMRCSGSTMFMRVYQFCQPSQTNCQIKTFLLNFPAVDHVCVQFSLFAAGRWVHVAYLTSYPLLPLYKLWFPFPSRPLKNIMFSGVKKMDEIARSWCACWACKNYRQELAFPASTHRR